MKYILILLIAVSFQANAVDKLEIGAMYKSCEDEGNPFETENCIYRKIIDIKGGYAKYRFSFSDVGTCLWSVSSATVSRLDGMHLVDDEEVKIALNCKQGQ